MVWTMGLPISSTISAARSSEMITSHWSVGSASTHSVTPDASRSGTIARTPSMKLASARSRVSPPRGPSLHRRAKDHDAVRSALWTQVGAQLDQPAHVFPAPSPHGLVRRRNVQPLRADRQPVKANEPEALRHDDVANLAPSAGRQPGRVLHQRERRNLDTGPSRPAHRTARIGEVGLARRVRCRLRA